MCHPPWPPVVHAARGHPGGRGEPAGGGVATTSGYAGTAAAAAAAHQARLARGGGRGAASRPARRARRRARPRGSQDDRRGGTARGAMRRHMIDPCSVVNPPVDTQAVLIDRGPICIHRSVNTPAVALPPT